MGKPRNTRHTQKYPKYPEIPESKKDTRKYPIVFSDTPTRPEPDPLPGILSNTRPDNEKPYPLGTAHIQYQPNTIKYNAMHQNAQHLPSTVSCSPKCFVRLCTSPVQMCEPSASKLCKYVQSMCEVWTCAKYESVRSASKLCKYESETWSSPYDQAAAIFAHRQEKKRHQERT